MKSVLGQQGQGALAPRDVAVDEHPLPYAREAEQVAAVIAAHQQGLARQLGVDVRFVDAALSAYGQALRDGVGLDDAIALARLAAETRAAMVAIRDAAWPPKPAAPIVGLDIVPRFFRLNPSQKRAIAVKLDLLDAEELRLPENKRWHLLFDRIAKRKMIDRFAAVVAGQEAKK